jgi:hypothetical protein
MAPKKAVKKAESEEKWHVEVVAFDNLTVGSSGAASGDATRVPADKLLDTMMGFAKQAGETLNGMDVCPSEVTIEGKVSLDVGGGVLLFGVSAGISVSMTWKFEDAWTATVPRGGKRNVAPPNPPDPPSPER